MDGRQWEREAAAAAEDRRRGRRWRRGDGLPRELQAAADVTRRAGGCWPRRAWATTLAMRALPERDGKFVVAPEQHCGLKQGDADGRGGWPEQGDGGAVRRG